MAALLKVWTDYRVNRVDKIKHKTTSSNIIVPLPKESDAQIEEVKKASGALPRKWDSPSENVDKKGKSKPNVVEEAITSTILAKKKIDTVNKTEKSKTPKKIVPTPLKKPNTLNSIDKSRSTQRTNLSNISNIIKKPT